MGFKILGQSNPAGTTNTDIYTVGAGTQTICSALVICETGGAAATFRVALRRGGTAIATQHYQVFDETVQSNEHMSLVEGWTLDVNDVVTVYASTADIAFTLHGQEITS